MAQGAVAHPTPIEITLPKDKASFDDSHANEDQRPLVVLPSEGGSSPPKQVPSPVGDPHELPKFDSTTLTAPAAPILYLPPLLSSLPKGYDHAFPPSIEDKDYRPLNTDTRLPDIDPASLALHKALHRFRPITTEYSVTPYDKAFNWATLQLPEEHEREWYCVVFRSKRKEGSDGGPLYEADKKAHEEAVQNGGLILYWYGIPHEVTGLNLATCIWQSRQHAIAANSGPHHIRAMKFAAASYEHYELQRFRLTKFKGETGLHITPFDRGDVGW